MAYRIIVSSKAQKEIENAIDYYALYSSDAPRNFIKKLNETYDILEENPFFRKQYKEVRSLKISRFPYSLYFTLNEVESIVKIIACFHNKRNPIHRPNL